MAYNGSDLTGRTLGQYDLLEVIGRGGMATVYRGYQRSVGREVAVKVLSPDLAQDERLLARFEREAHIIARLDHPHILTVHDFGRQGSILYLVMRLMTGGSLLDELQAQRGPLPLERTLLLARQIASALDYAHGKGVVHRDLKPSNVLLDDEGNASLTDFGIAKMVQGGATTGLTAANTMMGTPIYMAPEQWRAEPVDARTDVYAFGIMVYWMLAGQVPFDGDTPPALMYQHLNEPPPTLLRLNPMVGAPVDAVLRRALAKHAEERFASAGAFVGALERAMGRPGSVPEMPDRAEAGRSPTVEAAQVKPAAAGDVPLSSPPETLPGTLPEGDVSLTERRRPAPGQPSRVQITSGPRPLATPPPVAATQTPASAPSVYDAPPVYEHTVVSEPQVVYEAPPVYDQPAERGPNASYSHVPLTSSGSAPPVLAPPSRRQRDPYTDEGPGVLRFLWVIGIVGGAVLLFFVVVLVIALLTASDGSSQPGAATDTPGTGPTDIPAAARPTVQIQAPADNTRISLGGAVLVQFVASGAGGISEVQLRRFGQLVATVTVGGADVYQGVFPYTPDSTGPHQLEVVAISGGIPSDPARLTLMVE